MANLKSIRLGGVSLLDLIYPVGSVYLSFEWKDPSTTMGGEWVSIVGTSSADSDKRFLLLSNPNSPAGGNNSSGATGGEATHKLLARELPHHDHSINIQHSDGPSVPAEESLTCGLQVGGRRRAYTAGLYAYTESDQPHNNMPPYIQIYGWKRIK